MSKPNDGGSFFPVHIPNERGPEGEPLAQGGFIPGASLRAWFAGMAMSSVRPGDWTDCKDGAKFYVDYADALIAELEKEAK